MKSLDAEEDVLEEKKAVVGEGEGEREGEGEGDGFGGLVEVVAEKGLGADVREEEEEKGLLITGGS